MNTPYVDENRFGHVRLHACADAREQHSDEYGAVLVVAGEVHAVRGLRAPHESVELTPELDDVSEGHDLGVEVQPRIVRRAAVRQRAAGLYAHVEHRSRRVELEEAEQLPRLDTVTVRTRALLQCLTAQSHLCHVSNESLVLSFRSPGRCRLKMLSLRAMSNGLTTYSSQPASSAAVWCCEPAWPERKTMGTAESEGSPRRR